MSLMEIEKGANRQLDKLTIDYYNWRLEIEPEWSTTVGVYKYNDKLESWNHRDFESRKTKAEGFLGQLTAIKRSDLDKTHMVSYDILEDILTTYIRGYKWWNFQPLNPFTFLDGFFTDPQHFVDVTPFDTQGDFMNFIVRIEKMPQQYNEMMEDARLAIQYNHTLSIVSVNRIPGIIDALTANESAFPVLEPFLQDKAAIVLGDALPNMTERMKTAIKNLIMKLNEVKSFIQNQYMPQSRKIWGIHGWSNGKENYRDTLRWHTSLNITPEEVHRKGLDEVDRIHQDMLKVMSKLGFQGSVPDFFTALKRNQHFLMNDSESTLQRYRDIIFKRIMPELPRYFKNIPNLPIVNTTKGQKISYSFGYKYSLCNVHFGIKISDGSVKNSPQDGIFGEYIGGTEDGTREGIFYVNVRRPEDITITSVLQLVTPTNVADNFLLGPTFMMVSVTLHETVPGHHLADSYRLVSNLPPFRKHMCESSTSPPFSFPSYTSYEEGWGLYAEYLGEEMGMYKDDHELMGRYSCEIMRACRLVVDTGLHYFCWDRDRAIKYFLDYTGLTREEAVIEIDRYITYPGQACAYKMGELKIKELRQKAMKELGSLFDLPEFHYIILRNGPMPLGVLENLIDSWIEDVKKRPQSHSTLAEEHEQDTGYEI